ncbi:hypothetical protein KMB26_02005, partial [Streptomyces sp. CYG20]|uniref:hypothetical protein n=1 Tax=Streptomyces sp. CYG20 TaxID=2838873 RepID=UPI001BFFCADA
MSSRRARHPAHGSNSVHRSGHGATLTALLPRTWTPSVGRHRRSSSGVRHAIVASRSTPSSLKNTSCARGSPHCATRPPPAALPQDH